MAWAIDSVHSEINFSVRHMMVSTVRGRFEKFSGSINFDEAQPARTTVDLQIEAASVNTREAQRDGHLKSPDFFDAEKYPYLTFKSKRIDMVEGHHAKLVGNLTIRDVTKEVVFDVEYAGQAKSPWGTTSAGFSAQTKINREDWGLTYNQVLETGGVMVGKDITLNVEVELVKQPEAAKAEAVGA
jgi:polyisoprenoid-binding protein YceI